MNRSWGWVPTTQLAAVAAAGLAVLTACALPGSTSYGQPTPAPAPATATAADRATQPMPEMPGMPGMAMAAADPAAAGVPDAPVATNTVAIQNFAFAPGTVTVKAGTTVTWTNQDQEPHTVTSVNGAELKSPTLNTGETFKHTFATPGNFDYLCTIHPFMTATVVVTP